MQKISIMSGSISRRFSIVLIGVVTILLIGFSVAAIFINISFLSRNLETRLGMAIKLAQTSLPTPLWNLDNDVVNELAEAIFLDESIVYIRISWADEVISEKIRPSINLPHLNPTHFSSSRKISGFLYQSSDIFHEENKVGTILIVMSRESLKKQFLLQVSGIIALTLLIIAAIWFTSIIITKKYISHPLLKLQKSASRISEGDLETYVDTSGSGEIGILSQDLDVMRRSIKQLFAKLSESKNKIEEHRRTLEHQVKLRTRELARSVDELKALGEISQAVNSTLDLESVLSSIVRNAVQLSNTDAGTIYVYDETKGVFVPRINYGVSDAFAKVLRESEFQVGDESIIGRAADSRTPKQIPDLMELQGYPIPFVLKEGYRALLAIPLQREENVIGSLIVRRRTAGEFSGAVINLLQTLAEQSVLAIQNARLFGEIEEKSLELEAANRHKSEFLANMSHELRTPMNAILGYTELILDDIYGDVPEKIREILKNLEKNGHHLLGLINDVLDLSKIEAGQLNLSLNEYSLEDVIHSVLTSMEALAVEKNLGFKETVPGNLPAGKGDEQRIAQVLLNLIGNAVKFTETGQIVVKASVSDGMFKVSVADTGSGMSDADQKKIFNQFQQVDGSSTRIKGGTGLGLTITKKIVEMHGGRIWVESTLQKGSTFWFTLPVRVEKQRDIQ